MSKSIYIGKKNNDDMNCTLISSSIVNLYLYYRNDIANVEYWLKQLENDLTISFDKNCKDEFDEYQKKFKFLKKETSNKQPNNHKS